MDKTTPSRNALLKRAASLRQQAEETDDALVRHALETVARGYEILAEKALGDEGEPEASGSDL
jgi:hypothetical protein